eukprot:440932_1
MAQELKKYDVAGMFASDEVIPDVVDTEPQQVLSAQWRVDDDVYSLDKYGQELTPTQVQNAPMLSIESGVDKATFYTVIMTDPDAKDRIKHEKREWVHFVVINVPTAVNKLKNVNGKFIFDVPSGETLVEYVGAKPPKNTGLHRYVLLVYEQTDKIDINKCGQDKLGKKGKGRALWSARKFAKNNNMKVLVAGNFFQAQNEQNKKK